MRYWRDEHSRSNSHERRRWAPRTVLSLLIALLAADPVAIARADETALAGSPTGEALTTWAMHWITEVMAGRTDRSQYAPAFAPQVTDAAIARMAHDLNAYGAAPLRAEIVQTKKEGDQTFTTIKFVFPRGDATSLLFGFDAEGKITGIASAAWPETNPTSRIPSWKSGFYDFSGLVSS
jgi:hypothetical protein